MSSNSHLSVRRSREDFQVYKSVDYSGLLERLFAWCVDSIIAIGIGYLLYRKFGLTTAVLLGLLIDLSLRIILTYFLSGTLGKLILGIRVVSRCSQKVSVLQVVVRELFKYISGIFLNFGYISIIVSKRKMAWHDMMAGTAVTSGGREEAQYAREIYTERPEGWNKYIFISVTGALMAGLLVAIIMEANSLLYDNGMLGFNFLRGYPDVQFTYKLASSAGIAGMEKNVIQFGDIDGDGGYEVFREGVSEGKIFIRDLRIIGVEPIDGDITIDLGKPIIQYRLLDMNGDKKDELAVLLEDYTLKVFKLDEAFVELCTIGPLEYSDIISVIKGKPADNVPYKLYILGNNNKLSVISMLEEEIQNQVLYLPGTYKLTGLDMGVISKENYLTGLTADGKLILYSYDGKEYKEVKTLDIPVKGKLSMTIKDINSDKKNEMLVWSKASEERAYPLIAAYDISGEKMELVWNGGTFYNYKGDKLTLTPDDLIDTNRNENIEMYMVSNRVAGQDGCFSIYIFEGDKVMRKINEFMRILSLSNIK